MSDMFDCHVHSCRSYHGSGELEDYIKMAIKRGLKGICFTEHAPLSIELGCRLTFRDLVRYLDNLCELRSMYSREIDVLIGLEFDYLPSFHQETYDLISSIELDYVLGSVHYIELNDQIVSVWDYSLLQKEQVWKEYFMALNMAITSNFFDAIAHADLILRSGISPCEIYPYFMDIVDSLVANDISYEINTSGYSKSIYSPKELVMLSNTTLLPFWNVVEYGVQKGVSFIVGSDAHNPSDVASFFNETKKQLLEFGCRSLVYFSSRNRLSYSLT